MWHLNLIAAVPDKDKDVQTHMLQKEYSFLSLLHLDLAAAAADGASNSSSSETVEL